MRYGMAANFVSSARCVFQRPYVITGPFYFSPRGMVAVIQMHRAGIRSDEKGRREAVLVKNRDSTLYLAAESIIEGQRYDLHYLIIDLRTAGCPTLIPALFAGIGWGC